MEKIQIGIIGGTSTEDIQGVEFKDKIKIETPFGPPSDAITVGSMGGVDIAFLPRHGKGHVILPSEVNYRANIFALKTLGVDYIISVSAVGSLKEDIHPRTLVLPDQFYDRTHKRESTFFGGGIVVHTNFADPICTNLRTIVYETAQDLEIDIVNGGTYVCMEGPQFSTRAESNTYRKLGFDIIGMTNLPEAKLAREAEICYTTIATVTDYDCWHPDHDEVDIEMIFENLKVSNANTHKLISKIIPKIIGARKCKCVSALKTAIITPPDLISDEVKQDLKLLIGKYLN